MYDSLSEGGVYYGRTVLIVLGLTVLSVLSQVF
jgi:hypothetical protein